MKLRDAAVRWVPRHSRLGRVAWGFGRRVFGPKVLVPGTLGDIFLLVPPQRLTAASLYGAGFPPATRIDQSWPAKARDVHRTHGYHLTVVEIGADPDRYLNAYRAIFVESSMVLLDAVDITPILWRLRGLGDPIGYHAAHIARDAQRRLDPDRPEEWRFAVASVAQLARRVKLIVVPSPEPADLLQALGSLTPIAVIPPGPQARLALSQLIEETLGTVKDPAHAALELWAEALADMGVQDSGSGELPGLSYLVAMETFKGTPSNLQGQD